MDACTQQVIYNEQLENKIKELRQSLREMIELALAFSDNIYSKETYDLVDQQIQRAQRLAWLEGDKNEDHSG